MLPEPLVRDALAFFHRASEVDPGDAPPLLPSVRADAPLRETLGRFQAEGVSTLAVVDGDGRRSGALSHVDALTYLLQLEQEAHARTRADRRDADQERARFEALYGESLRLLDLVHVQTFADTLLEQALESLRALVGVRYAALGLTDEQGKLIQFFHSGLTAAQAAALGDPPRGRGLLGAVIRENQAIRLENLSQDVRAVGFPPNHPPMRSLLALPVCYQGQAFGRVYLCDKRSGEPFTSDDERLVARFADALAQSLAYVSAQDARQRMHQALVESNLFLDSVIENLPSMIFVKDAKELKFVRVNRAGEELLGLSRDALIGRSDREIFPAEQAEAFIEKDRTVLAGRGMVEIPEEPIRTCHRGDRMLRTWKIPILGEDGAPRYLLGISEDITERRAAEAALRSSEANLAHAQRIARLGNWEWDVLTDRLVWSDEIYRIFGLDPGRFDASYDAFLSCVHPDDREWVNGVVQESLRGAHPYHCDYRVVRGDGTVCVVHQQAEAIRDASGRTVRVFGTVQDVTERKQVEERLNRLAYHDGLTGLPNRALAGDRLRQAIARAERTHRQIAVMFLDLDRFKIINDTLGHDAGDLLLKAVAERLCRSVRGSDTVARLGGDEFIVLLEHVRDPGEAAVVARKLLECLHEPVSIAGRELFVTTSIGIAVYPRDGREPETLLKNADAAMYLAKELGKNTFQFFTSDLSAKASRRLALEQALRQALDPPQFRLHYQPQVELESGRVIATEALLRWPHREWGMVAPAEFIPVAEETGFIAQLGAWVLRTACRQQRAWLDAGFDGRVAVNLSMRQLRDPGLVELISQVLLETGLPARCLELELTESMLLQDVSTSRALLNQISDLGVSISLDDFGTGYSSLSYLKRFPIDILKIDRSFVADISTDADDAAIITAIIAMAHSLDIRVVAEGVETQAQLEFLRAHRCDAIQGHLAVRPQPPEALTALMRGDACLLRLPSISQPAPARPAPYAVGVRRTW